MQTQSSEPAPEVPSSNFACNLALPGIVLGLGVSVPINGLFRANASSDLGVLHMEGSISLGRFVPSGIRWGRSDDNGMAEKSGEYVGLGRGLLHPPRLLQKAEPQ